METGIPVALQEQGPGQATIKWVQEIAEHPAQQVPVLAGIGQATKEQAAQEHQVAAHQAAPAAVQPIVLSK